MSRDLPDQYVVGLKYGCWFLRFDYGQHPGDILTSKSVRMVELATKFACPADAVERCESVGIPVDSPYVYLIRVRYDGTPIPESEGGMVGRIGELMGIKEYAQPGVADGRFPGRSCRSVEQ